MIYLLRKERYCRITFELQLRAAVEVIKKKKHNLLDEKHHFELNKKVNIVNLKKNKMF